jgi:DNA-binding LytR/AlgR family response regulator
MTKLNCIIVDDEPLAREGLEGYVKQSGFLELVAVCDSPMQAMQVLGANEVHLMFLDIQMPGMTGIDFLQILKNPPMVVITTAYPDYALESFQLDVLDYLMKPVSFTRFLKAATKAREYFELKQKPAAQGQQDYFFIKSDAKYEKVFFDEILFIEGLQNYVTIHTKQNKFITHITMKSVEEYLPSDRFVRVHKSFIVSVPQIDTIEGNQIRIGQNQVPISRDNKDEILNLILNNKLLKR